MLVTWLSYRDLIELVSCCLRAPTLGHTIVYGVSANRDAWWNNSRAAHPGVQARDRSEVFRSRVEALPLSGHPDRAGRYQGGGYVEMSPCESS